MPNNKNDKDNKNIPMENNEDKLDIYSDDKTKEIVSNLFDEFAGEGETNYFADYSDPFMDSDNDEDEESLGESIARRRKRNGISSKKSIVFRKKSKKNKNEEVDTTDTYEPEDNQAEADIEDDVPAKEPPDLEKTIILPKLSNFFKKSTYNDEEDDEDIDDFFAGLARDSAARTRQAAETAADKENSANNKKSEHTDEAPIDTSTDEKEIEHHTKENDTQKRYAKNAFEDFKSVYDTSDINVSDENDENDENDVDDEDDEDVVEIGVGRIVTIAAFAVCAIVIAALTYNNINYANQLEEARNQITELQKNSSSTYETELEELKQQVTELTAENESLQYASTDLDDPHTAAVQILSEAQSEIASEESTDTSLSQEESSGNTYTVQAGDTFWSISQSVYGNGADYQKILDANGLTESSVLSEGQVLNIPN